MATQQGSGKLGARTSGSVSHKVAGKWQGRIEETEKESTEVYKKHCPWAWRDGSLVRRALAARPEDAGSVPNIHMVAHNLCNSGSRGLCAFFWPVWAPGMTWYTYIYVGKMFIYIWGGKNAAVCFPSGKLLPVA